MKLADVLQIQFLRTEPIVAGETGYVMDIVSLSGRREIAQLHVVNHSLTKGRHGMLL